MANITIPKEAKALCQDWLNDHRKRKRPMNKCHVLNDAQKVLKDFIDRKKRGTASHYLASIPIEDLELSLSYVESTLRKSI